MAVFILIYGSEIWTKTKAKIENAQMNFEGGCICKDQIRNAKAMEELNIFNLNNTILKSRSQWKHLVI
jgi:hypothetical protein